MATFAYSGSLSMKELQTQIEFAEQHNYKLVDCSVYADKNNQLRTACDFEPAGLPPGILLDPIKIRIHDSPEPNGFIFSDNVVCDNKLVFVDFYR
jgi:hypothetical protein